jgi:LacI family transcriptional regulator
MSNATIYEVAERARVSIATVSNVINAPERVKAATRERVLAAIDELGFVPKTEAIARARKGLGRIGVIAPFTTYASFNHRLQGIIEALREYPYELVIYDQESLAVRNNYLATLPISQRLDGLIVMSLPFDDQVAQRLLRRDLATVLVEFARPSFSSIEINNTEGGSLAGEYLASRGYTRCAFLGEEQASDLIEIQAAQRLSGYRTALETAGRHLPDEYISLAPYGVEEARRQAHALLDLPEPPDAIFTHSDIQAVGVIKAARDRSLSVPDELAIIGFDDLDIADYMGLTTIRQPLSESGHVAVRLLMEHIDKPEGLVQQVTLPLSVIQRDTA